MELKDGIYKLTGIDYIDVPVGWDDDPDAEGVAICLNGVTYVAYVDPNDGYRSYGVFMPTDIEMHNTFPPQKVRLFKTEWEDTDEDGWNSEGFVMKLFNVKDNSLILEVGTDYSDAYYPMAIFDWHPENLPINKK